MSLNELIFARGSNVFCFFKGHLGETNFIPEGEIIASFFQRFIGGNIHVDYL